MAAVFQHVAIVECADQATLDELLAAGMQRFMVRRLGPDAIVVDHERLAELRRLFERLGQTPRVTHD